MKIRRLAVVLAAGFLLLSLPAGDELLPNNALPEHLIYGIPGESDLLLNRRGFSLGYNFHTRQAVWVCYILSAEQLSAPGVSRKNRFRADPAVRHRPVRSKEYDKTGFDRGHLVSAADMAFAVDTMRHSFFMTNISPQIPGCNRGIWKRLETQTRRWALKEGSLCIVTGPIFGRVRHLRPDDGGLLVPEAFFKVILDLTPPMKMIGFIIPNETSRKHLRNFAVTVDEVEHISGLDFFSELEDGQEELLEKNLDLNAWDLKTNRLPAPERP